MLSAIASATAAQTESADSIIAQARYWRDMDNHDMAVKILAPLTQGANINETAVYELALTRFEQGKTSLAMSESKRLTYNDCLLYTDAMLLVAACRERQGFDRAAVRIYKKLIRTNSAAAANQYATMLHRKGRNGQAEEMARKSISIDKNVPQAHLLLADIMISKGERYKAMLSLYYFLLINDNAESQRVAYKQLVSLWRRSAQAIEVLKHPAKGEKFNAGVEQQIKTWATNDSIAHLEGIEAIEALHNKTTLLFDYLLQTSEQNLDFWQVTYTDFLVTLQPRNFTLPYIYYISDATYHPQVLAWVNENMHLFNEFRLWMEAQ